MAITCLWLIFSNWNFHDVCQRFLYNQEQSFGLIRQKTKYFPIDPHLKISHFFIMGVYGEISHFLSDQAEIFVSEYIKNVDTHHESFILKKQVIKKFSPKSLWQTYMKWTVTVDRAKPKIASTYFAWLFYWIVQKGICFLKV